MAQSFRVSQKGLLEPTDILVRLQYYTQRNASHHTHLFTFICRNCESFADLIHPENISIIKMPAQKLSHNNRNFCSWISLNKHNIN